MNEELTVDTELQESVQDDAAQAPVAEENPNVIALTELMSTEEEAHEAQDPEAQQQEQTEKPITGGIKGRLMESEKKGHDRGYQEGYSKAKAEWDAERARVNERLAKLEEIELREEAAKLAKDEGCSEALAMRILRAEKGLPPQTEAPKNTQPRDENGRFVKAEERELNTRAQQLADQAKLVQRLTGVDVAAIFQGDKTVQQRIASGEIDFADLAEEYKGSSSRKAAPPVVRSSSGTGVKARGFSDLSDEAFDRIQSDLALGKTIDLRR